MARRRCFALSPPTQGPTATCRRWRRWRLLRLPPSESHAADLALKCTYYTRSSRTHGCSKCIGGRSASKAALRFGIALPSLHTPVVLIHTSLHESTRSFILGEQVPSQRVYVEFIFRRLWSCLFSKKLRELNSISAHWGRIVKTLHTISPPSSDRQKHDALCIFLSLSAPAVSFPSPVLFFAFKRSPNMYMCDLLDFMCAFRFYQRRPLSKCGRTSFVRLSGGGLVSLTLI